MSSDKDASSFDEYFGEMPWTALPFADRGRKGTLSSKYGVSGIPTLVVLDVMGDLVTKDGRSKVDALFSGEGVSADPASSDSGCVVL